MTQAKEEAIRFVKDNQTPHCRTLQEGAKYLVGKLTPPELPAPSVWWEVLKISRRVRGDGNVN